MNEGIKGMKALEEWYRSLRDLINEAEKEPENPEELQEVVRGWIEALEALEASCPELRDKYERDTAMRQSFTREQIDFICWQIGDWYLEWKNKIITDAATGQHRLGFAKEMLKKMICGE